MPEPNEVEKIWHSFREINEVSSDAIQLLSLTTDLNSQRIQSLKNKANSIRQGLAELENVLDNLKLQ